MSENNNTLIHDESTGLYVGILLEDMIETVKREKKLYCDVHIPSLFLKDQKHPLTYVPLWCMSLPLKKGDKVLVQFNQENYLYPVLYKNPTELPESFFNKFDVGKSIEGGIIEAHNVEESVSVTELGEESYIIKTSSYTVIHQNDAFILLDKNNKVYLHGNGINIICSDALKIDSSGSVDIKGNGTINITTGSSGFIVNNHLKVTK